MRFKLAACAGAVVATLVVADLSWAGQGTTPQPVRPQPTGGQTTPPQATPPQPTTPQGVGGQGTVPQPVAPQGAEGGSTEPQAITPQSPEERRPYRGIYGGGRRADSPHSLTLSGSVYAAYDDNVLEAISNRRVRSPWLQRSGVYEGAQMGLAYDFRKSGERVSFSGGSNADVNYVRQGEDSRFYPGSHSDVGISVGLTESLSFSARQSLAYRANYNMGLVPVADGDFGHDIGTPSDPDLDVFGIETLRTASTLSLSQKFGRYTSLRGGYHYRTMSIINDDRDDENRPYRGYRAQGGSARLVHARPLTRYAELQLGYGISVNDRDSGTGEPRIMHNVIAGINYGRPLSISRRTSFSFGTGSSIAVREQLNDGGGEQRTRARLTGHATLTHELGRTWTAQLGYTRGFRTRDGFGDLYFSDAATASLQGLFTRRWSFSASTSWAVSEFENQGRNRADGVASQVQTTYGISRYLAAYASYVYFHYRYDEDVLLDPRLPRQLDRHGVRVGLMSSIPLIR